MSRVWWDRTKSQFSNIIMYKIWLYYRNIHERRTIRYLGEGRAAIFLPLQEYFLEGVEQFFYISLKNGNIILTYVRNICSFIIINIFFINSALPTFLTNFFSKITTNIFSNFYPSPPPPRYPMIKFIRPYGVLKIWILTHYFAGKWVR